MVTSVAPTTPTIAASAVQASTVAEASPPFTLPSHL
jgi:hypothetical protein